jgi:LemA protein
VGLSFLLGLGAILGVVGLIVYFITIRNGLLRLRDESGKAWADLDFLLKQRADELPKLAGICRGYMPSEQKTVQLVVAARTAFLKATTVEEKTQADGLISEALKSLYAVAEKYPDLEAEASFRQLRGRLSALDERIAAQRRCFDASVSAFNARLAQIPANLVAAFLHLQPGALFHAAESRREDEPVKSG